MAREIPVEAVCPGFAKGAASRARRRTRRASASVMYRRARRSLNSALSPSTSARLRWPRRSCVRRAGSRPRPAHRSCRRPCPRRFPRKRAGCRSRRGRYTARGAGTRRACSGSTVVSGASGAAVGAILRAPRAAVRQSRNSRRSRMGSSLRIRIAASCRKRRVKDDSGRLVGRVAGRTGTCRPRRLGPPRGARRGSPGTDRGSGSR